MVSSGKLETRHTILEAALHLFKEQGPANVRMEDVAVQAGVSRQAVYLHFGSRTGLLVALVQYNDEREGLVALARPVWEADTGAEALDRFVALNADYNPRIYPLVKALLSGRYTDEAIAAAAADRLQSRWDACRQLILWLQRDGGLDPAWEVDEATDLLWTLTSVQVWEQLVMEKGWSRERYEHHLCSLLRRTFVNGGSE